ncbi:fumarylacetoacetate hydrolase family protein [Azospirillum griseum]|uniref:Fumarylacetoacetate hydrolase family protein n=1 Tax=Azospirillum griseum TaxID=2496639 RepID=A0A431VAR7_9PROT|nr:fumarylacetoacetate hydrolase family protein [Azospirillum griseum]RTR14610.1 fumarylacetoacetate hydrolase family protein [Azospirillum griseum]
MRLVTFTPAGRADGPQRVGALIDGDTRVVDLTAATAGDADFASMLALIAAGEDALGRARDCVAAAQRGRADDLLDRAAVRLAAPVPKPESIRDWACFPQHMLNMMQRDYRRRAAKEVDPEAAFQRFVDQGLLKLPADYYELPRFHACNRHAVIGPEDDIEWPSFSEQMDFELEFGFYIGKRGKDIPYDQARSYIFGYTVFNDLSARDMQAREARFGGKSKEFDTGNVMGPCLVTADEIPDPYNLRMIARVNGEVWCNSSSNTMGRTFEQVIAHMSESTTLYPGDFFGSGTVGTGCGMENDRYLNDGDVIELEVDGIGILRNRILRRTGRAAS